MSFYHTRFLILLQSFAHFTPTPQKIVAQKPKTISSKSDKIQAISVFSLFFSVPILYNNT